MKVEDFKKGIATTLLLTTLLTGCGSSSGNNNKKSDNYISVAIIVNDDTATIMEVGYYYVSGGYAFFEYPDNSKIAFSNAIIMEGFKDYSEVEEFVKSIVGEDGNINYYNPGKAYTRTR